MHWEEHTCSSELHKQEVFSCRHTLTLLLSVNSVDTTCQSLTIRCNSILELFIEQVFVFSLDISLKSLIIKNTHN